MIECDAIVVGAGAAGIAAARALRRAGLQSVAVLEARGRAGGRAHSSDELGCGVPLDHGAQWIHGYAPDHPMVKLADELDRAHGPMMTCFGETVLSDGREVTPRSSQRAREAFRQLRRRVAKGLAKQQQGDCSWMQASEQAGGAQQLPPEEQALMNLQIYNSCENYEGARLDCWSAKHWNKATCLPGGNGDVGGGYGGLIASAAEDLHVLLNRRVESIAYPAPGNVGHEAGFVTVRCKTASFHGELEETYCAPRCVVTLPLGVLQADYVHFEPELPACKVEAIRKLGRSLMDKVELLWHSRWWDVGAFEIASMDSTPTWHPWPWFHEPPAMHRHPLGWAALVCYVTGRFAEHIESLTEEEAVAQCMSALRSAFPTVEVPEPAEVHIWHWGRDKFALGSWTYFTVGSSPADAHALRQPLGANGCVAFAGEHTCDGSVPGLDMGTVHGAWLSGELAAKGLLERPGEPEGEPPLDGQGRWRCRHRHCTDGVIPEIAGYSRGALVEVTESPSEIAEELRADPDEAPHIAVAQQYCGKRGKITQRSCWGWLRVEFADASPARWWTPYCLWVLTG